MNKPNTPVQLPRWLQPEHSYRCSLTFGGPGLAIQGGAFAGGRAIDAMTGRSL